MFVGLVVYSTRRLWWGARCCTSTVHGPCAGVHGDQRDMERRRRVARRDVSTHTWRRWYLRWQVRWLRTMPPTATHPLPCACVGGGANGGGCVRSGTLGVLVRGLTDGLCLSSNCVDARPQCKQESDATVLERQRRASGTADGDPPPRAQRSTSGPTLSQRRTAAPRPPPPAMGMLYRCLTACSPLTTTKISPPPKHQRLALILAPTLRYLCIFLPPLAPSSNLSSERQSYGNSSIDCLDCHDEDL